MVSSPSCGYERPSRESLKWADVLDEGMSDDALSEAEDLFPSLLSAADDSYREAPVAGLEDSREGLNLRLATLAASHAVGCDTPKDFEFLFQRVQAPRAASLERADEDLSRDDCASLNADAPEFIPTLTHACPVVGFCQAIPEYSTVKLSLGDLAEGTAASVGLRSPRRWMASSTSSSDSVGANSINGDSSTRCSLTSQELVDLDLRTPTKSDSNPRKQSPPSRSKTSGAAKKRRAALKVLRCGDLSVLQSPAAKRTKSQENRVDSGTEMLEPSEEDWQRRCATRQRAIVFGKETTEYVRFCEARELGDASSTGLLTPDPLDRSISKRQWKYTVDQWRNALKRLYGLATDGADTGSTVSADEGLSIITGITDEADAISTTYGDDGSSS